VPVEVPDVWPAAGEDLCYLAGDWRILQRRDGHRWSLDDLVTAWFAAGCVARAPARFVDLGCGIGAVLLLLAWRFPAARGLGVEAQVGSAALARRSLRWNGAGDRCEIRTGDLRQEALTRDAAPATLVTATPPYLPPGTATTPRDSQRRDCHEERRGGIEAYCEAAARVVAADGCFVSCAAALQRPRVARAAGAAGLRVVARCDVVPRAGKDALFTVSCMRPAAAVATVVSRPPLVVRDRQGQWTAAFREVRRAMGMPA
jgi:tRNA1(Val) A37 N6-methylase TrmN6